MPTPEYITAEKLREKEDSYLRVLYGYDNKRINSMTDAERASLPEIQELRTRYAVQPVGETVENIPSTEFKEATAGTRAYQGELLDLITKVEEPKSVEEAIGLLDYAGAYGSRNVGTAAYDPIKYYTTADPIEQMASYKPSGASTSWLDSLGRQVSVPVESPNLVAAKADVEDIIAEVTKETGKQQQFWDDVAKQSMFEFRAYLGNKDPAFNELSVGEQRKRLYSVVAGINYAPSIDEANDYKTDSTWFPAPRNVEQGNVPDYTDEQMAYLQAYRTTALKNKAASLQASGLSEAEARAEAIKYVNNAIGQMQWWQDPNLKQQKLSGAPEFQGVLGLGTYQYPAGATVESTPAYALRLLMAPANMISGMIGGALAAGDADYAKARATSEITPATTEMDPTLSTWDKSVRAGLDNVKRNRGATEEIYDLGIYTGIDNYVGKAPLFGAALLADVVFVPIVPGAGLASGVIKGAEEASKIASIAGKTVKVGDYLWDVTKTALKETSIGSTGLWAAEKMGLLAAPNDIRFIAATGLSEAATRAGAKGIEALPPVLKGTVKDITTFMDDLSTKGLTAILDSSSYTTKDVARWTQAVLRSNPELAALVKGETKLPDIISKVAVLNIGVKALKEAAINEAVIKYVIDSSKDMGARSLYLLTARTAVPNAKVANAIVTAAKESDIGKALQTLASKGDNVSSAVEGAFKPEGVVLDEDIRRVVGTKGFGEEASTVGTDLVSWISVPEDIASKIVSYLRGKRILNPLEAQTYSSIIHNLSDANNKITVRQFNALQEMIIDDTARALYPVQSLSSDAISLMSKEAREELIKSIPLRDGWLYAMGREKIKALMSSKGIDVHPLFQNTINQIQQTVANMPSLLRTKLKEIQSSEEVWKAYRLSAKPANAQEAFATLLFKPKGGLSEGEEYIATVDHHIRYSLIPSLQNLIFKRNVSRGIGDYFKPIKPISDEDLLVTSMSPFVKNQIADKTEALQKALEGILIKGNPASYMDAINAIKVYIADVKGIVKGTDINVIKDDRIEDLLVSMYYDIESQKIISGSIHETLHLQGKTESSIGNVDNLANRFFGLTYHIQPLEETIAIQTRRMIISRAIGLMNDTANGLASTNPLSHLRNINLGSNAWDAATKAYQSSITTLEDGLKAGNADAWLLLESIDDAARTMLDNYRLLNTDLSVAISELDAALEMSAKTDKGKALGTLENIVDVGTTSVEISQLKKFINDIGASTFSTEKLKIALHKDDGTLARAFNRVVSEIRDAQYFFMLTIRTRFHGVNIMTAPFIMASTIGAKDTAKALYNYLDGFYVAGRLTFPKMDIALLAKDNQIAFRTATGKAYTWKEIVSIARRGGIIRTEGGFTNYAKAIEDAKNLDIFQTKKWYLRTDKTPIVSQFIEYMQDIAPFFDTSFRASALISSLKAGETEMTAINKAREALYDYGKLSEFEQKYIASWFAFYSFTRASVGNALWNLLNNPTRVANQIKASKGFRGQAFNSENERNSLFYEAEYMQGRPLWSATSGIDKQAHKEYLPMLPLIDSYLLIAKVINSAVGLLKGESREWSVGDYAMERSNPMAQALFSKRLQDTYGRGYIDSRHVAVLKAFGVWDLFKQLIGEPDEVNARPGETVWIVDANGQGKTYSFAENPQAIKNYVNLLRAISVLGGDTWIKDYAPLAGKIIEAAEPIQAGIDMQTGLAEQSGLITDVRTQSPIEVYSNKTMRSTQEKGSLAPSK